MLKTLCAGVEAEIGAGEADSEGDVIRGNAEGVAVLLLRFGVPAQTGERLGQVLPQRHVVGGNLECGTQRRERVGIRGHR